MKFIIGKYSIDLSISRDSFVWFHFWKLKLNEKEQEYYNFYKVISIFFLWWEFCIVIEKLEQRS